MKRTIALVLGLLLCLTAATAAAGDAGDPLISLSYLEGEFARSLEAAVAGRLDASDAAIRAGRKQNAAGPAGEAGGLQEHTLKRGDALSGFTGLAVAPLSGRIRLETSAGAVVDVSNGTEAPAGQTLLINHRYIVAENARAVFTVESPTAVLSWEGGGTLQYSAEPDYYAIALALRKLDLFRGSGSGIGEGFDLHLAPTRGEALVMFLRVLGEEDQALACTDSHPFTDVPGWLDRYVAWAYARGYANGVAADRFGCGQTVSAVEYEEFLLRALGYSVAGVDDYATSLERGLTCGALTGGEYVMLRGEQFLRAHAAYISYYALDVPVSGSRQTLAQRLTAGGHMTAEQLADARTLVNSLRIA